MLQDCCAISWMPPLPRNLKVFFPVILGIRPPSWLVAALLPAALGLVPVTTLQAQERVRTAAQQLEIETFRVPPSFRLGPLQEELNASVGFEFTDNSTLTRSGKISRFSLYESIGLNSTWVLSHFNQLKFNFGGKLSEDFFSNGRNELNVGITPNSLVQFQFAVSDVRVRLYDQFSYVQEPSSQPTATNTAYLNSLTNTVGTVVSDDFNLAILSLSADYTYNNESGTNAQGQTNASTTGTRNSFRVGSSLAFRWSPTVFYGFEDTLTHTTGSSGTINIGGTKASPTVNSINVGPFVRGALTRLTDFDLAVGATLVDTKPSFGPTYYFSAVLRHQLSRNWQLILSASHDLIFTTGTDLTEETVLRAATQYNLTRFVTLTVAPNVTFGDAETGGNFHIGSVQGPFKEYVFETGLIWKLRKHIAASLTYDFRRRDARAESYSQNTVAFDLSYKF
jgi:hypothetical protein